MLAETCINGATLAYLRAATRPAHDKLEGTLNLLDKQLSLPAYTKVLERLYGFWCGWEPQMAALFQDEAFLHPRRRMHLLKADLATLGLSAHAVAVLPVCPMTILHNGVEALGSLYVMEGSTLGGRVIERNVEQCLGLNGQHGCSYFAGYSADTGTMWRSFLARLDQAPAGDAHQIANGATATFERLASWLPQPWRVRCGITGR